MYASRKRPATAFEEAAGNLCHELTKRAQRSSYVRPFPGLVPIQISGTVPVPGTVPGAVPGAVRTAASQVLMVVEAPPSSHHDQGAIDAFGAMCVVAKRCASAGARFTLSEVTFLSRGSFGVVFKVVIRSAAPREYSFAVKVFRCDRAGEAVEEVELAVLVARLAHRDRCISAGEMSWVASRTPACPWIVHTYGMSELSAALRSEMRDALSRSSGPGLHDPHVDIDLDDAQTCRAIVMELVEPLRAAPPHFALPSLPRPSSSSPSPSPSSSPPPPPPTTLQAWVWQLQAEHGLTTIPAGVRVVAQITAQIMVTMAFCSNTLGLLMNDPKLDNVLVRPSRRHRMVIFDRAGAARMRQLVDAAPLAVCMIDFSLAVAYGRCRASTGAAMDRFTCEDRRIMGEMCLDVGGARMRTRRRGAPTFTDHVGFMLNFRRALQRREMSLCPRPAGSAVRDCVAAVDSALLELCGGLRDVVHAAFVDLVDAGFRPARWFWKWLHESDDEAVTDYVVEIANTKAVWTAGDKGDADPKLVRLGLRSARDLSLQWAKSLPKRLNEWAENICLRVSRVANLRSQTTSSDGHLLLLRLWREAKDLSLQHVVERCTQLDGRTVCRDCGRANIPIRALPAWRDVQAAKDGIRSFAARLERLAPGISLEAAAEKLRGFGFAVRPVSISRTSVLLHAQDFLCRGSLFDAIDDRGASSSKLAQVTLNGVDRERERIRLMSLVDSLQADRGGADRVHLQDLVRRFKSQGFDSGICETSSWGAATTASHVARAATALLSEF